jgi:hypothetical protein
MCQVDIEPYVTSGDRYTVASSDQGGKKFNLIRRSSKVPHKLSVAGAGEGSLTIV